MRPSRPANDLVDGWFAHGKCRLKRFTRFAFGVTLSNLQDLQIFEFRSSSTDNRLPVAPVRPGMQVICGLGNPFEIAKNVIGSVKIFVVRLASIRAQPNKGCQDQSVNLQSPRNPASLQCDNPVSVFVGAMLSISIPASDIS